MHIVAAAIGVLWLAFWIYWLAAAPGSKPGRSQWGRWAWIRVGAVVVVLVLLRTRVITRHVIATDHWLQGIGLAMFLAGLALAIWARQYLGSNWGTPMSQKDDPELVTRGPYRRIRHPIYSGISLAMVGTAVAISWYWLVVVVLLVGYFVYSATREEAYLTGKFPDAYPAYKRSTKMLIPYIF